MGVRRSVQIQIDGEDVTVPERLVPVVRWLLTEAAPLVCDRACSFKVVINLGTGNAEPHAVIERHQRL